MKKKILTLAGICLAAVLVLDPISAQAGNTVSIKDVTPQAGASAILKSNMTTEEYISKAKEAQGSLWGYTNLGVANVDNNLNIRQEPNESAKLIGKMPKNSACEVLSIEGEWAHIKSGEVEGYAKLEYLYTGVEAKLKAMEIATVVATVNADALKIRTQPNTESEVLTTVPMGAELDYIETVDGWHKVLVDAEEAYVSADYADVKESLGTAVTLTELLYGMGVSDVRVDLVEYAREFLGNPYVWGGTSLTKGADCSGFTLSIFKNYGVKLSHSSQAQSNEGTKISMEEAKPGDLIFYGNGSGSINHVAIYIGGGQVIHASSPRTGIKISKYNYRSPVKVVRVLQD